MRMLLLKLSIESGKCQKDMDSGVFMTEVLCIYTSTLRNTDIEDENGSRLLCLY